MNNKNNTSGISLIELIVAVAIIATLSVSSFAGFGYLGDILRAKETAGILQDTVKQEELKILRGDFTDATINFLENYMVIEEGVDGATLDLNFDGKCTPPPDYKINFSTSANLIKKDQDGKILEIKSVTVGTECIDDFDTSEDTGWSYQLVSSNNFSDIIRFVHFNINRGSITNSIKVIEGNGTKIEIKAPYGKKYVYDKDGVLAEKGQVTIKIEDSNKNLTESFTLQ